MARERQRGHSANIEEFFQEQRAQICAGTAAPSYFYPSRADLSKQAVTSCCMPLRSSYAKGTSLRSVTIEAIGEAELINCVSACELRRERVLLLLFDEKLS